MKYKINAEVEATPEEVAELIKRVGSNWQRAASEIKNASETQLIDLWHKSIEESINKYREAWR